jgi:hypothetical protein
VPSLADVINVGKAAAKEAAKKADEATALAEAANALAWSLELIEQKVEEAHAELKAELTTLAGKIAALEQGEQGGTAMSIQEVSQTFAGAGEIELPIEATRFIINVVKVSATSAVTLRLLEGEEEIYKSREESEIYDLLNLPAILNGGAKLKAAISCVGEAGGVIKLKYQG